MMKNDTSTKNEKLPFPSTVNRPAPNADVQAVSREIVDTSRDKNNLYTSAGNVHYFVRDHYVDPSTGTYGIESLICRILSERGAVLPPNAHEGELRKVAIGVAMYAFEIIEAVRETFGEDRYPNATIYSFLAHFMSGKHGNGKLGKIKLTSTEDQPRESAKPRVKYYLNEVVETPSES